MSRDPIIVKSAGDIEHMRRAGKITAAARSIARQAIAAGITTKQIDREVHEFIVKNGARPTFLGYGGFPASACISASVLRGRKRSGSASTSISSMLRLSASTLRWGITRRPS